MMQNETPESKLREAEDQFVLEWGRMSSSWGINRTMAQIHALLIATGKALSVDEIIDRLGISRGNASMSLRDLMDWGVVQRFRRPGDRKDIYSAEADPWQTFAKIVRERKRRELDPTRTAILECLVRLPDMPDHREIVAFRRRLNGLLEIFALVDWVYEEAFKQDDQLRAAVESLRERADPSKDAEKRKESEADN